MNRVLLIALLVCGGTLIAFSSDERWQPDEIVGFRFELVSDTNAVVLGFTGDGIVQASVGQKDGGWGFLWQWKIDDDGLLRISDSHGKEWMVFRKLRVEGAHYFMDDAGTAREYVRAEWPGYWDHHKKEQTEPIQPAEPTALAPAAIGSRACKLSLAARLAHG